MRFFKNNAESIIRLFVNQIGITIFALFLYTAAGAMQKEGESTPVLFQVLISVFSILFYFVLIYTVVWEIGAKDKIRIDAGRAEKQPFRGMLLGVYANIPNFVITGIAFIAILLYTFGCGDIFYTIYTIPNIISRFFASMYLGVILGLTNALEATKDLMIGIYYFIFPAISFLVTHFAYVMGLHEKRIFPTVKNKKGNK